MVFSGKISDETRALVRFLGMEQKYSIREIAKKAKVSKSTVARYLRTPKHTVQKKYKIRNVGRPKALSPRDVRLLKRSITPLRKINPNFTLKELIRFSGLQCSGVSYSTFYRQMHSVGFKFLNARRKGILYRRDCGKRYKFARKCQKILKIKPNLFHSSISFYLDGVSFVFKRQPMQDATAPKGKIWRKKSEGLRMTSKGSKELPAGKRLHFLVAIAFNRGVVLAKEYEHMSGDYFSGFVRRNLSSLFTAEGQQKWFVMDNDPSQRSKTAKKAINDAGATLFEIPARSPDLNPIENLFHIVKKQIQSQAIAERIYKETWHAFKARVRKTILNIPITYVNNLLLSMPKRIDAVIKCRGFRTKY
jgi:transposase